MLTLITQDSLNTAATVSIVPFGSQNYRYVLIFIESFPFLLIHPTRTSSTTQVPIHAASKSPRMRLQEAETLNVLLPSFAHNLCFILLTHFIADTCHMSHSFNSYSTGLQDGEARTLLVQDYQDHYYRYVSTLQLIALHLL